MDTSGQRSIRSNEQVQGSFVQCSSRATISVQETICCIHWCTWHLVEMTCGENPCQEEIPLRNKGGE
jgi:hypothetical protein